MSIVQYLLGNGRLLEFAFSILYLHHKVSGGLKSCSTQGTNTAIYKNVQIPHFLPRRGTNVCFWRRGASIYPVTRKSQFYF